MNNTRILFGATVAILLAVIAGLYFENQQNKRGDEPTPEEIVEQKIEEKTEEVAAERAVVKEELAAVRAEMDAQRAAHQSEMKAMREMQEMTQGELDKERIERERVERIVNQRKMAIRTAPQLTKVIESFPDQGFLVIGAGQDKNVSVGQKFRVRRGDSVVGKIEITSVDSDHAVAEAVRGSMPKRKDDDAQWFITGDEVIGME